MATQYRRKPKSDIQKLSRRHFLKLAATGVLAGCAPQLTPQPTETPTDAPSSTPLPTSTSLPHTLTPLPSHTPTPLPPNAPTPTPTVVAANVERPNALGRVIQTHHAGAWDGGDLQPNTLRQMLDASITNLTGLNDAREAWSALFAPGERVALKVNTIAGSSYWTHVPLVMAVAESLQSAGLPAEQIVIFDRATNELNGAGFTINKDGAGVRCYGTDNAYTGGWSLMGDAIAISDVLLSCDALINIPVLKTHSISGISYALKNHYGTFDRPGRYHAPRITQALGELSALDAIHDRTRLTIGDALTISTKSWYQAETGDSILMSRDPVAVDAVAFQLYANTRAAAGMNSTGAQRNVESWLAHAASLGLGVNDLDAIEQVEVSLS